jgi:hypothetical protein
MPVGSFAQGLMKAFSDYVSGERATKRKAEDEALGSHVEMLKAVLSSPNVNPNIAGKLLTDIATLNAAKGGRKSKGGMEGFMGASELPISQLLAGLQRGTTPMTGDIYQPQPETPKALGLQGGIVPQSAPKIRTSMDEPTMAPIGGVDEPPLPSFNPSDVQASVQQAQKVGAWKPRTLAENQPMFMSPEQMSELESFTTGMKARKTAEGQNLGFIDAYRAAKTPEEKQLILERSGFSGGGAGGVRSIAGEVVNADGTTTPAWGVFDPASRQYIDPDTQQPIPNFRPRTTTGSTSLGAYYEQAARALGYPSGASAPVSARPAIEAKAHQLAAQQAGATTAGRMSALATGPLSHEQAFVGTQNLQDDWRKANAPTREMQRQYTLMEVGMRRFLEGDKIGGSNAVLMTFQKVLDPPSVVREAEYERIPGGLGLLQRMEGAYERLKSGGAGVPADEMQEIVSTAKEFLNVLSSFQEAEKLRLEETARRNGIDPALITGTPAVTGGANPAATLPTPPGAGLSRYARPR